ncbi:hypothetical protein EVAR_79583_1 [Eumeta japonica]|uniref:Uncharacterized protein n=1 Tax=Eumeta variegata TaxID=151549 RepID=A0A4C1UFK4_EUMVA|nr:hypothetical protein EVAR_79583_1 [Eumeta japonica]
MMRGNFLNQSAPLPGAIMFRGREVFTDIRKVSFLYTDCPPIYSSVFSVRALGLPRGTRASPGTWASPGPPVRWKPRNAVIVI